MSLDTHNDEDDKSREKFELIHKALISHTHGQPFITYVEELLKKEGDINYKISNESGIVMNVLQATIEQCSHLYDVFNLLLDYGVEFTYKDIKGQTVVHKIIQKNKSELCPSQTNFHNEYIDAVLSAHVKFNNFSNPSDENGFTHFHAACMSNHAEAIKFFLENGIDVNLSINKKSWIHPLCTPLHLAVQYICPNAVEILLTYGANVYLKNTFGYSPLHLIIKAKIENLYYEMELRNCFAMMLNIFMKCFIDNDSDAADVDDFGFCKLHAACLLQDPLIAEDLLARVTNINQAVNFDSPICPGYTALHFAAMYSFKMFELLVRNGADIGLKSAIGLTPFDLLLHYCNAEQIQTVLLMKPEWKDIVFSDNETKLIDVISVIGFGWGIPTITKENKLLASGLSISYKSPLCPGYTVLHLVVTYMNRLKAKMHYNETILSSLKIANNVTTKNANGSTPLHLAFYLGKEDLARLLLKHQKQPINSVDCNQLSHLHIACALQDLNAVEVLSLDKDLDVNLPVLSSFKYTETDIVSGSTALHINVVIGRRAITKMLLKRGADVNAQDANGFTAVHRLLISRKYDDGIPNVLLSHKNLKNITSPCGLSHLHVASYFSHKDGIIKLLKLGADVNAPVMFGEYNWKIPKPYRISIDPYSIQHRPFFTLPNYSCYTPLHFSRYSTKETKFLLTGNRADLLAKNDTGSCILHDLLDDAETHQHNFEIINHNIFARKYCENEYGITKLHIACFLADVQWVKNLIKVGANVNAKVHSSSPIWQGYAPLHCIVKKLFIKYNEKAVIYELKTIVQLLLKHEADVLLTDDNNDTPFHLIKNLEYNSDKWLKISSFMSILLKNSIDFNINPINNDGLSLFHLMCIMLKVDEMRKFFKCGVNVNEPIKYFSSYHPGSTPLHLIVKIHCLLGPNSSKLNAHYDKVILQTVDFLLDNGANVNGTDTLGNTPLIEVIKCNSLRKILMKKFISNGADVHAMNLQFHNAFELLLRQNDATWEEIEIFLKTGYNFNMFNPASQEGYLAIFLGSYRNLVGSISILDQFMVLKVLDHLKIIEVTSSERSPIHNVVSLKARKSFQCNECFACTSIPKTAEKYLFYQEIIEQLLMQGCDINHQDPQGQTALHLAVDFANRHAIVELLRNGADINIVDENGKTALFQIDEKFGCDLIEKYYTTRAFHLHMYKLGFCGLPINEQNKEIYNRISMVHRYCNGIEDVIDETQFLVEIEKSKSMEIGNTALFLYEFLIGSDMDIVYMNMSNKDRREVELFFENIGKHKFLEIHCLLKLKYGKTIEGKKLLEPARISFDILIENQLPELCTRMILKFLTNEDLKRLIASVE